MIATRKNEIDGWLHCPVCNKKQFPILKETEIHGFVYQCKACTFEYKISIEPLDRESQEPPSQEPVVT